MEQSYVATQGCVSIGDYAKVKIDKRDRRCWNIGSCFGVVVKVSHRNTISILTERGVIVNSDKSLRKFGPEDYGLLDKNTAVSQELQSLKDKVIQKQINVEQFPKIYIRREFELAHGLMIVKGCFCQNGCGARCGCAQRNIPCSTKCKCQIKCLPCKNKCK